MDIKYHFIRDEINEKLINLNYLPTGQQTSDIFTKALPAISFKHHCEEITALKIQRKSLIQGKLLKKSIKQTGLWRSYKKRMKDGCSYQQTSRNPIKLRCKKVQLPPTTPNFYVFYQSTTNHQAPSQESTYLFIPRSNRAVLRV